MPQDLHVRLPDKMNQKLEKASEQTGLGKSEITRRGILEQVNELEGER